MYIFKQPLKVVIARIETFVISGNKFLYKKVSGEPWFPGLTLKMPWQADETLKN
jgi:hypothetical protein